VPITPWVLRLLVVNVVMFFLSSVIPGLTNNLMLVPALVLQRPWTVVSYMFLHGGTLHLLFNMLGLYFFGPRLEEEMGGRDFLLLYFISGITGALLSFVTPFSAIIGASGAVYGVLLGFAYFWPRDQIMIWGILPVEARWLVVIMTGLSLFGGVAGTDNTAHYAHLGGFAGGYLYLRLRGRKARRARIDPGPEPSPPTHTELHRWARINKEKLHEVNRAELERIQEKIRTQGAASLTSTEREFLDRFSPDEPD
jgi:membrane associated rhomboid family serine protease